MDFEKNNVKIIILTGKAGSGKSEVAKIIKENKKCMILSYASYLKEVAKNVLEWDGGEETKPRDFLQQFGEKIKKDNPNIMIDRVIEDINTYSYFYDLIVISDARFLNEITYIKNNFKDVIVVNVYGRDNDLTEKQKNHITEIALDGYEQYDYRIYNDEDLIEKVKGMLVKIYE